LAPGRESSCKAFAPKCTIMRQHCYKDQSYDSQLWFPPGQLESIKQPGRRCPLKRDQMTGLGKNLWEKGRIAEVLSRRKVNVVGLQEVRYIRCWNKDSERWGWCLQIVLEW